MDTIIGFANPLLVRARITTTDKSGVAGADPTYHQTKTLKVKLQVNGWEGTVSVALQCVWDVTARIYVGGWGRRKDGKRDWKSREWFISPSINAWLHPLADRVWSWLKDREPEAPDYSEDPMAQMYGYWH